MLAEYVRSLLFWDLAVPPALAILYVNVLLEQGHAQQVRRGLLPTPRLCPSKQPLSSRTVFDQGLFRLVLAWSLNHGMLAASSCTC